MGGVSAPCFVVLACPRSDFDVERLSVAVSSTERIGKISFSTVNKAVLFVVHAEEWTEISDLLCAKNALDFFNGSSVLDDLDN